jgi:RNA polymerase subunit RPABC4/transcription elongation factor Spt4
VTTKKKLITRMATWTGGVLAAALVVLGASLLLMRSDRERFEENQRAERQQVVERSRKYVSELAKRIDRLPVDPTLVGEIESRYYEERADGPMQVWAMGTDGGFLFGVPKESFSRLNALYDREVTPRLKEGLFFERQSFLLGHLDDEPEIDLSEALLGGDEEEKPADLVERLVRLQDRSEGTFVLSSPLKTAEGAALGSLYLRRTVRPERDWHRTDDRLEVAVAVAAGTASLAFLFLWVLLPTWVYVDGTERGVRRARLFAFLTVISSLVGLVVYLISRPDDAKALACPGCGREVNGGAFCPHCGRDLSASFCATCRYPLKPDWAFCPSCRTETRSATEAPAAG